MAGSEAIGLFRIGRVDFALPAAAIVEVLGPPTELAEFPQAPKHVCGAFNHRGRALPMIDLAAILQPDRPAETARAGAFALVLRADRGRLAVQVDAVRGVVLADAARFTPLAAAGPRGLFQRAYTPADGGRIAVVLELPALIALEGVRVAEEAPEKDDAAQAASAGTPGQPVVVFRIGAVVYGLPAPQVRAVELRPDVLDSPLGTGWVAGYHRLHGRLLPLVRGARLFGGASEGDGRYAVVVQAGDRTAALLVDEIVAVETLADGRQETLPDGTVGRSDWFAGCWARPDGGIALLIDGAGLVAAVGATPLDGDASDGRRARADSPDEGAPEQFLVFRCHGRTFAAALRELDTVIRVEQGVVDLSREGQELAGLCTRHGRTVRLIDLGRLLGATAPAVLAGGTAICVATAEGRVGFLVESVDLLLTARARDWTGSRAADEGRVPPIRRTIAVKRATGDRTAGVLDLASLAHRVGGVATAA